MTSNFGDSAGAVAEPKQRLDKWLCFARIVKTRQQAAQLIEDGHVRIDSRRTNVIAKTVGPGDVLTIALARQVRVLRILAIATRRGPARESRLLFEDLEGPPSGEKNAAS